MIKITGNQSSKPNSIKPVMPKVGNRHHKNNSKFNVPRYISQTIMSITKGNSHGKGGGGTHYFAWGCKLWIFVALRVFGTECHYFLSCKEIRVISQC